MKGLLLLIGISLLNSSCQKCDSLGKYVYCSNNGVVHTSNTCEDLKNAKDDSGHRVFGIEFYDTTIVIENEYWSYCHVCFNDKLYEHLKRISERNEKAKKEAEKILEDVKWVYNKLISLNYDMESFESFVSNLRISEKRRKLYDALVSEGCDMGTFEEFEKYMGYGQENNAKIQK